MTATTSVPSITFADTGVTLPAETAILAGVQADINTAFGGGVNSGLTSPQGQLAQSFTAIIGDKNDQILEISNQVDPDNASGRWQDAIGRIYFIDRIAASGTVVSGTCVGLVGTVIPAGSLVQDVNGYIYASLVDATIPASGSVSVDFQCQTTGPIICAIGALTTIYKSIVGWDSVTNTTAGTEGVNVESRADFEARRKLSVASNSVNMVQSVYAAVLGVDNVVDAYVIDNPQPATVLTGATNYPVVRNSLYVAVSGGDTAAIAQAIWSKKSGGCNYNGDTSYDITDTSGYSLPYPTYTVSWVTPTAVPVFFAVFIAKDSSLPSDITTQIQSAIVAAFNGTDGGVSARIASRLYAGRYYAGVAALNANVEIYSITLGLSAEGQGTSLLMGIDQRPTLDASNISVTLV